MMPYLSLAKLRVRLLLLVLVAIVPALGLTLYTNIDLRRMVVADAKADAVRLARLAASDQEDLIRDTRQLLFALAQLPQVRSGSPEVCSAFFAQLLRQYPQYILLGVIAPDGDIFCSAYPPSGSSKVADQAYFQRALQTRDFAISDYQVDQISGKAILSFGYPVLDEAGQVRAVVFASLDLIWLNQLAAEAQLPRGSTFTVIDRNGTILVRYPDPEIWVGRSVPEAPIVELILTQGEGTAETPGVDGVPRLFAFTPLYGVLGGEQVFVTVGIPTAVAFADANRVLIRNLIGLGLVTLLALVAVWLGGHWFILRWVNVLVRTTRRLSSGDLSARTGLPYGRGELSQLARAFDEMAEALEQHISARDRAEAALRETQQMLEQRVADRTRALSALYDVTAVASGSLDLETILDRSLKRVLTVMGVEAGVIHLLDESKGELVLSTWQKATAGAVALKDLLPSTSGLIDKVFKRGQPLIISNLGEGLQTVLLAGAADPRSYLGVPMRAGGQVLGVLSILGKAGQQFAEEEVVLLASIADQVGVAVENGRLYRQTEQLAVMEERSRLARELHDSVTQSLYSLTLYAEVGRRAAEAGDLQHVVDYLAQLGQVAQQTLKEMRSLVFELRPMALETEGLGGALQQRLDAVEKRAGVEAHLIVEGTGELSTIMEEGLYRIAQEALNNVLKHAGASVVTVRINSHGDWVELEVRDNGRAFDPANIDHRGGVGLTSMRERAEQLGGSFTISSRSGEGTMVKAKIPTRRSWSRPVLPVDILVEVAS
jgi:nitrate/nitrite-specific signal transduction histidine kinase